MESGKYFEMKSSVLESDGVSLRGDTGAIIC